MVVTTQIVKKRKRKEEEKRTNERTKEGRKRKHSKLFNMRAVRARMHTCRRHCPVSENEWAIAITQRQHIYDREERWRRIHGVPYVSRTEQRVLDDVRREKMFSFSSSLMLSLLLHLIQAQTDCFLLHCDCTIERCACTVVPYSVTHHQWRGLIQVHIVLCLRVIRFKNTLTDKNRLKKKRCERKPIIFVR